MRNPLREHLPIRLLLLGALSACGSSTVPSLSADSLNQPAMRQLAPRELDIRVEDLRPVSEEDRTATERHVKEVLQELLASSGVSVTAQTPNQWFITVQQPASDTSIMDPAACVSIQSELAVRRARSLVTEVSRCRQYSTGGAQFGSGVLAFESAFDAVLQQVDAQLDNLLLRFAEPRFNPERIRVPRLEWLNPREVALVVKDELSDGSSGASLEQALGSAFARSGVRVTEHADYKLTWLLRRPAPEALGSEPIDVCRQLDVTRSRDSRSSNGSWWTCGSPSANDALVSDILVALDRNGL